MPEEAVAAELATGIRWPEIFFIRHGQTAWNAERRYQGRQDIPLDSMGEAQADQNGRVLAAVLSARGIDPTRLEWHASPLVRTRETMRRVRAAFTMPLPEVRFDERLVEISFGALEGKLFADVPANMATAAGSREASYWEHRPDQGENYRDVEHRLQAFAAGLRGPSVIVAHGGIARTLRVLVERAPIVDAINWAPPQDAVLHFSDGAMEVIADVA